VNSYLYDLSSDPYYTPEAGGNQASKMNENPDKKE
jgi:hypothetical protein